MQYRSLILRNLVQTVRSFVFQLKALFQFTHFREQAQEIVSMTQRFKRGQNPSCKTREDLIKYPGF